VRGLLDQLDELAAVDLALGLTLLDLLLHPVGAWYLRPFFLALAATALLFPRWRRSRALWTALALATGLRVVLSWPLADNHAFLLAYWCLAIALALRARDGAGFLAFNGRLLIGLTFAFASLWKLVLSPDFVDGTFFRVAFLLDERFADFARLFGGMTQELLEVNRDALTQHADGVRALGGAVLPPRFEPLADAATLWTLACEIAIALAFLWPTDGLARFRDSLLLLFCATTYAVATVEGFGWLLLAMGVAQCDPARRTTRLLYLACFALILFYREIPWAGLLADL